MVNNQTNSFLVKIETIRPSLSRSEKQVADFILEHTDDAVAMSITSMADKCNVSTATITRFCKKLEVTGYQMLKIELIQSIVSPLDRIYEGINETDDSKAIMEKVFSKTINALQYTMQLFDYKQLEMAVDSINQARQVVVVGLGNSAAVAQDMHHKMLRLGILTSIYCDNHMQRIAIQSINSRDVCFCISQSGSSRDIVQFAALAKEKNAKIIALVGVGDSPLTEIADIRLNTAAKEAQFHIVALSSRIAQYAVIDTLYTCLALRHSEQGIYQETSVETLLVDTKF